MTATATASAAPPAESRRGSGDRSDMNTKLFNRLAATCLTLFALIWLVPFVWALITSLRPNNEITSHPMRPWSNNWNLDTYWALILPVIAAPVAVFVFHSFMRGIPDALIEAARLDGASWFRIYYQVCMPLCRPAISAVAILTFISTWNQFLWPLLALTQTKSQTIPVGLGGLIGGAAIQYAETMASAVLGILPLLAVFLLLQRQIVQGVANTGIK